MISAPRDGLVRVATTVRDEMEAGSNATFYGYLNVAGTIREEIRDRVNLLFSGVPLKIVKIVEITV